MELLNLDGKVTIVTTSVFRNIFVKTWSTVTLLRIIVLRP
jgi:hypothetical protein